MFYLRLATAPGVFRALIAVFVGALPIGMLNLALLMLTEQRTGSVGAGGLAAGAFGLGNAVGLLVQGRLLDRFRPRPVLYSASLLCATALVLAGYGGPLPWLVLLAGIAGSSLPAVTTAVRATIPTLLADSRRRAGAYALMTVFFQSAAAAGPLLVSGFLVSIGVGWAVIVAAGLVFAAAAVFPARRYRHAPAAEPDRRRAGSAGGRRTLLAVAAGAGLAGGLTDIAVPAAAIAHHDAAVAGIVSAAISAGDLCGGIAFGGRLDGGRAHAWLTRSLALGATGAAMAAAVAFRPVLLIPVMFAAGLARAPLGITLSAALDRLAAPNGLAAAYGTMIGVGLVATAGGSALAGTLVGTAGPAGLFGCAATVLLTARLWAAARRHTIAP